MAHREQRQFIRSVRRQLGAFFQGRRVLEVGSRSVNGSVRPLFEECEYLGIDAVAGELVDVVVPAHAFRDERGFDVVICCEVFEHDPWFSESVAMIASHLLPGGLFLGTCAGPERAEHGTRASSGPGAVFGPDADHYRNITTGDLLLQLQTNASWDRLHVEYGRGRQDLYWYAVKTV